MSNEAMTIEEKAFQMHLVSEVNGLVQIRCEGAVSLPGYESDANPLVKLLGPGVFARSVLLDLQEVTFLDTSGLSWLVDCHERCRETGGLLVLHSIPAQVRHVLRLLHMEQVLHLAEDTAAALSQARRFRP